jgi:NADH dehydrogenase FAD-containing subunit
MRHSCVVIVGRRQLAILAATLCVGISVPGNAQGGRGSTAQPSQACPDATDHSYFGHTAWEENAPGLKSIEGALEIRRRFLLAFEQAEQADTEADQRAWLTLVLIGGGPTGVELAGMIPTVARHGLPSERIDARTILWPRGVATIGRYRAVALIAGQHLSGAVAWWTWLFIHILYLAGFRNRLSVMVEWVIHFLSTSAVPG